METFLHYYTLSIGYLLVFHSGVKSMQSYDIHGERIPLISENIKPYIDQFEQQHEKIDTIILSTKTFTREAAKIMCGMHSVSIVLLEFHPSSFYS